MGQGGKCMQSSEWWVFSHRTGGHKQSVLQGNMESCVCRFFFLSGLAFTVEPGYIEFEGDCKTV